MKQRIAEMMSHYLPRQINAIWRIRPTAISNDRGQWLKKREMRCGYRRRGMAIEIDSLQHDLPQPAGFQVDVVEDFAQFETELHLYLDLDYALGTHNKLQAGRMAPYRRLIARARVSVRVYRIACMQRDGASAFYLNADAAGLYDMGVSPAARRQGIGAAMAVARCVSLANRPIATA